MGRGELILGYAARRCWVTRGLVCLGVWLVMAGGAAGGPVVRDADLQLTFKVPDGFEPAPDLVKRPAIPYAFRKAVYEGGLDCQCLVTIERLGGVIGRDRPPAPRLPAKVESKPFTIPWKDCTVHGLEVLDRRESNAVVTYNVQIPLRPHAIQVKVSGWDVRRKWVRSELDRVVAGVDGPTNWLAGGTIAGQPVSPAMMIAITAVIVVGGLAALWFVSRRGPKGLVLAIAVVVWLVGNHLATEPERWHKLIGGSLKMLGVGAGLLGLADLGRKRG